MGQLVQTDPLVLAVAGLLCVLGTARATRLWIYDKWPPVVWLRDRFLGWAEQTRPVEHQERFVRGIRVPGATHEELTWRFGWQPLVKCPFCVAPYFALASIGWAWAAGLDGHGWSAAWWLAHLWFAVSYLAAMVVVRDEPPEDS